MMGEYNEHYFGGMTFYWANDFTDSTGSATYLHRGETVIPKRIVIICDYCGVEAEDNKRVNCKQCGAPLRKEK